MPVPSVHVSLTHHLPAWLSSVKILRTTDTPESSFEDRGEVRVCKAAATSGPGSSSAHRCKNYGCQAEFDVRRAKPATWPALSPSPCLQEACNDETSCRHHTLPPVFQDLRELTVTCPATSASA